MKLKKMDFRIFRITKWLRRSLIAVLGLLCIAAVPAYIMSSWANQDKTNGTKRGVAWAVTLLTVFSFVLLYLWGYPFGLVRFLRIDTLYPIVSTLFFGSSILILIVFFRLSKWYVAVALLTTGALIGFHLYRSSPPLYYPLRLGFFLTVGEEEQRLADTLWEALDIEGVFYGFDPNSDTYVLNFNGAGNATRADPRAGQILWDIYPRLTYPLNWMDRTEAGLLFVASTIQEKFNRRYYISTLYKNDRKWPAQPCPEYFWWETYGECIVPLNEQWGLYYSWSIPPDITQRALEKTVEEQRWPERIKKIIIFSDHKNGISDFTPLTQLVNLEYLSLWIDYDEHTNFTPLTKLKKLKTFSLIKGRLVITDTQETNRKLDLSFLRSFEQLESLNLVRTDTRNLNIVAEMTNLVELDITRTAVDDLAPISALTELNQLNIADTDITSIAPLAELEKLETVVLNAATTAELSLLSQHRGIRDLGLTQIDDSILSTLSEFENLEQLILIGGKLSDISPLAKLPNLKILRIFEGEQFDLSQLSQLTQLEILDLFQIKRLPDLNAVASLKKLTILTLDSLPQAESIDYLSPLLSLPNLESIHVGTYQPNLLRLFRNSKTAINCPSAF